MPDNIPLEWGIPIALVLTVIWLIVRWRQDQKTTGGQD